MVLTRSAIQYLINITYILEILEILATNYPVPPTEAELMGGCQPTREGR